MRTAAVFGSTGLIGSSILRLLSQNKEYQKIYSYTRKKQESELEKVENIEINSDAFVLAQGIDDVFVCLGTTMKKAGSKEEFSKVDLHLVVNIAKQAKASNAKHFIVVSSIGADPNSSNFYLKTKGEMEEEVKKLDFEYCGIVRPSLLLGKRKEFRLGEKLGIIVFNIFSFIFVGKLKKYKGIKAEDVAKSMIIMALNGKGKVTIESNILKKIANEYNK